MQEILARKVQEWTDKCGKAKRFCCSATSDLWANKLKCSCGSSFHKCRWRVNKKTGEAVFGYRCRNQINNGSLKLRLENGLDTEGYCGAKMVGEWKLDFMAKNILEELWTNRQEAVDEAITLIRENYVEQSNGASPLSIAALEAKIEKGRNRLKALLEMRMDGEITKNEYAQLKAEIETDIAESEAALEANKDTATRNAELDGKLAAMRKTLEEYIDFSGTKIAEPVLKKLIVQVTPVADDRYKWTLNLYGNLEDSAYNTVCGVQGRVNNPVFTVKEKSIPRLRNVTGGVKRLIRQ